MCPHCALSTHVAASCLLHSPQLAAGASALAFREQLGHCPSQLLTLGLGPLGSWAPMVPGGGEGGICGVVRWLSHEL